ncbi:response regulator transcription factor, partial [Methylibium sp.]|nr:DNA-binding response regulator [Methylibium sp.]
MPVRIVIVDDHAIVRAGLRQYLAEQVDLQVVGEAASGREALEL